MFLQSLHDIPLSFTHIGRLTFRALDPVHHPGLFFLWDLVLRADELTSDGVKRCEVNSHPCLYDVLADYVRDLAHVREGYVPSGFLCLRVWADVAWFGSGRRYPR